MFCSIIVPIYNVEEYIDRCVESLLDQGIEDYEILLIDDASADESLIKARKWATLSDKIKVIEKNLNSGLSDTRNLGIKKAEGDYIFFVDSDDFLTTGSINKIKKEIECCQNTIDVAYFGLYYERNGNVELEYMYKSAPGEYNARDFMIYELKNRNMSIPACMACYRREFIVSNNLFFETGILHEDVRWSPVVVYTARYVLVSKEAAYHYFIRDNSITQKKDRTKNGIDLINTCYFLMDFSNEINNTLLAKLFRNYVVTMYLQAVAINNIAKENPKILRRTFPIKHACFLIDIIRSVIFLISPTLYSIIYTRLKEN